MADNIRARIVKLILGEYTDSTETKGGVVTCRHGKTIPTDLVQIPTHGGRPNTAHFHHPKQRHTNTHRPRLPKNTCVANRLVASTVAVSAATTTATIPTLASPLSVSTTTHHHCHDPLLLCPCFPAPQANHHYLTLVSCPRVASPQHAIPLARSTPPPPPPSALLIGVIGKYDPQHSLHLSQHRRRPHATRHPPHFKCPPQANSTT
ncbi:hypothetical protein BDQ17DRAFT_1334049 [Cyathus striatus]|nr:hypothetical protein BDQ17DRAFT_1334049 [Cyathus striatus]